MLSILPPIYALRQIEWAANLAVPMKLCVGIRRTMPYSKDGEYSFMWTRAKPYHHLVQTRWRVDLLTGPCYNQRQPLLTHSNFLDFHDSSTRLLNPNWQGASFWNIDAMLNVGIINCITENQKLSFNFRWNDKGPSVVINSLTKRITLVSYLPKTTYSP